MVDSRHVDISIIGAGPAGMAAAIRLAEAGLCPTVFDLNTGPGGQIYRQLSNPQIDDDVMGADYLDGRALVEAFVQADIDYRPMSRVWWLDKGTTGYSMGVVQQDQSQSWHTNRLILASGAMERGWPFPGWQLPGVMTAGAAQILLKQGALLPCESPVLAGSGPLLYLLAWQYLRAGQPPALVLDLAPESQYKALLCQPRRAWYGRSYLFKGLRMLAALRRAGIPVLQGVDRLQARGRNTVESVRYRHRGQWTALPSTLLLTHFGVVPEPQLTRSLNLAHSWEAGQQSFLPERDETLAASERLWIAGDGGGIGGAINAIREGRLAALALLRSIGAGAPSALTCEVHTLQRARRRDLEARAILEAIFRLPPDWLDVQPEDTLLCRCESVSRGEVEQAIAQGAAGPNQLKAFTRCGMGPCQGRQCGEAISRLLAKRTAQSMEAIGYYHIRPPVHSVTLGELARQQDT